MEESDCPVGEVEESGYLSYAGAVNGRVSWFQGYLENASVGVSENEKTCQRSECDSACIEY